MAKKKIQTLTVDSGDTAPPPATSSVDIKEFVFKEMTDSILDRLDRLDKEIKELRQDCERQRHRIDRLIANTPQ